MTPHNEWEKEFDERFSSTPAIADGITDSEECCNCGEDLSLELYDAFSEGYKMAIDDAKQFIATLLAQTRQETVREVIDKIWETRAKNGNAATVSIIGQLREEYGLDSGYRFSGTNNIKDE